MRSAPSCLFENGVVWAGASPRPAHRWLLVERGTVAEFGSGAPPKADERIDLAGSVVLPGFVDAHSHLTVSAWLPHVVDASSWSSGDDLQTAIARHAATRPAGAWIIAFGADLDRLGRLPRSEDLDRLGGDRPVLVADFSLHRSLVSSRVLRAVRDQGIRGDVDTWFGRATGIIWEGTHAAAFAAAMRALALEVDEYGRTALLDREAQRHLAHGITACHDPCVSDTLAPDLVALRRRTALRLSWSSVSHAGMLEPASAADYCTSCGEGPSSAKLFVDGAHRCALCLEPGHVLAMMASSAQQALGGNFAPVRELTRYRSAYRNGKVHMPYLRMEPGDLARRLDQLGRDGVRPKIHAVGNHAVACTCKALVDAGCRDATIEHLTFLSDREIDAVAATGAVASLQPGFMHAFGAGIVERGMIPRMRAFPMASLNRAGVPLALSSDNPCGPLDPLANLRAAVERRLADRRVVDAREALSLEAAVEAYTVGGYRAVHGRTGGGLVENAPADFVVISGDILSATSKVIETWIGGVRVYRTP